jgi:hypothetical protein
MMLDVIHPSAQEASLMMKTPLPVDQVLDVRHMPASAACCSDAAIVQRRRDSAQNLVDRLPA